VNSLHDAATDLSATAADIAADIADGRECPGHLEHARELLAILDGGTDGLAPGDEHAGPRPRPSRKGRRLAALDGATAGRPTIACLCGSTRFGEEFRQANLRLTLDGQIVLSIGCDTKRDDDLAAMTAAGNPASVKARLDELHLRKIDLADYVLVINPGGYIGESTWGEIAYARATGTPVHYLEPQSAPDGDRR
jgi:hypothetical protein